MGQQPNKYHVSDDGNIFRINEDGSFTSVGNVAEQNVGNATPPYNNRYDLKKLETQIINDFNTLTIDEVKYIASESQNDEAISRALEFDSSIIMPILINRFENGATFLEFSILNGCQYDENDEVRLALANCKRKFEDDGILTELGKDKNPQIKNAARTNPNYTGKGGGCLGVVIFFIVTSLSFITII